MQCLAFSIQKERKIWEEERNKRDTEDEKIIESAQKKNDAHIEREKKKTGSMLEKDEKEDKKKRDKRRRHIKQLRSAFLVCLWF